jgi:hypothetical protein
MSNSIKLDLREWLVLPVLVPIFLGLMIAAAATYR